MPVVRRGASISPEAMLSYGSECKAMTSNDLLSAHLLCSFPEEWKGKGVVIVGASVGFTDMHEAKFLWTLAEDKGGVWKLDLWGVSGPDIDATSNFYFLVPLSPTEEL